MNSTRKRIQRAKISVAELKKTQVWNYLKLKKIWKWQKRSKSDPLKEKEADESNILSYTVSGTLYGTVSSIPAMQAIEVWVLQSNKTVTTRRENKLSRR
jgi:hypothetical protein